MATVTSVATGDWSAGATWDTNPVIPVNGDTVIIANTHTVTFDVDMTGWANGVTLTINAGGTLDVKDDAGSYYLMTSADISLSGTLSAGTSVAVPLTGSFTIDFNASGGSIVGAATGRLYLYCTNPTNPYIQLSAQEVIGQTVWSVDTDVTADVWAAGDLVHISEDTTSQDREERTIAGGGIAANTITVTAGLTAQKEIGAYVILVARNIRIFNTTDYCIKTVDSSAIGCCMDTCGGCVTSSDENTYTYTVFGTTGTYHTLNSNANTYNSCIFTYALRAASSEVSSTYNNCAIFGAQLNMTGCTSLVMNSVLVSGSSYFFYGGQNLIANNCTVTAGYMFRNAVNFISNTCVMADVTVGLDASYQGIFYNTDFSGAGTENTSYDGVLALKHFYVESNDHSQVSNAYKAWTRGGIVTSQTASPPTGYTIWYELAVANNSQAYPCFRQYETVVLPGTALEVSGMIRIAGGEDLSTSGKEPQLQIIDKKADPLIDSTQTPLDYDIPADVTGVTITWQDVSVIWANTGDSPRTVIVRMIAYNDNLAAVDVDTVWSVASYQEQIAAMYNSLLPVRTDVAVSDTTTSFTLTSGQAALNAYRYNTIAIQDADDGHWEQRRINAWTAGRVVTVENAFTFTPAVGDTAYILSVAYHPPTDLTSITDKLPTNNIMGSSDKDNHDTDIDAILVDTGTTIPATIDETIKRLKRIGPYP